MKLLLVDERDRLLLIHAKDPRTGSEAWHPVGGGIEAGESLQRAAEREAHEETGLEVLPMGTKRHGFHWWSAAELMSTTDTVFPAGLGALFAGLLRDGPPDVPMSITSRSPAAN